YRHYKKYSPEYGLFLIVLMVVAAFITGNQSVINSVLSLAIPIGVIVLIIVVISIIYRQYKENQLAQTGIFDIDEMQGTEFEQRLMVMYKDLGYRVEHIGGVNDAGVDLIIEKYGRRTAVQAKRYNGTVGEAAVQQVNTGKTYHHCQRAIIITNSTFTKMAYRVARATNVQLCTRNYLIKLLQEEMKNRHGIETPNEQEVKVELSTEPLIDHIKVEKSQLVKYIVYHLSLGEKWEELQSNLIKAGWSLDIINDAFYSAYNPKNTSEF
ncbi:MAG TPA: restriction endonuclease, partial [Candidatus Wunengus sp. YC60]|uniref:restriction endonuclease n=1 Tax=Candidatus Wunengus sp. YC60 TaxID=3367697 RepID=UPI004026E51E